MDSIRSTLVGLDLASEQIKIVRPTRLSLTNVLAPSHVAKVLSLLLARLIWVLPSVEDVGGCDY